LLKLNVLAIRKALLADIERRLEAGLRALSETVAAATNGESLAVPNPNREWVGLDVHRFAIDTEATLDRLLRDHHEPVESASTVSGILKKVTLAEGFILQIEATANRENNARLYDMHVDQNVIIMSAQLQLFDESELPAEPAETDAETTPTAEQMELETAAAAVATAASSATEQPAKKAEKLRKKAS
jgi:hypothetical protein